LSSWLDHGAKNQRFVHEFLADLNPNDKEMENGRLAEHWDVLQDEATKAELRSGLPMFGDHFTA